MRQHDAIRFWREKLCIWIPVAAGKGVLGEKGVLNGGKELQQRTQRAWLVWTGTVMEWSKPAERWGLARSAGWSRWPMALQRKGTRAIESLRDLHAFPV